jgi:OHS family lactose permease-like MFS transporter
LYIGFVFSAGSGAIEAYIERVSRNSFFEYGKARMFGCLGWGCAPQRAASCSASIRRMFSGWDRGGAAADAAAGGRKAEANQTAQVMNALGANQPQITAKTVFNLFRQRRMWMFILYVIGVACVYDVFDQQFALKPSSPRRRKAPRLWFCHHGGEICNAIIMFCSPWIINRIGAKNTLLIAGVIMATRIIGSSFATTAVEVIALKMLHALEVPFLLVGAFKYITGVFDTRLSATIYLIGFQFAKQSAAIFLSAFAGNMYDRIGFQETT